MKKKIFNGILLVAALFATSSAFVSCKDNDADEIANAKIAIQKDLNTQIADLKAQLDAVKASIPAAYNDTELRNKISDLTNKIADLEVLVKSIDAISEAEAKDLISEQTSALKEQTSALKTEIDRQIAEIQNEILLLTQALDKVVYSMVIEGTYNPIFGAIAAPVDVKSQVLAAYIGDGEATEFHGEPIDNFYTGDAGTVYFTVNPNDRVLDGNFSMVNSIGETYNNVVLSAAKKSDKVLTWGWNQTRANETGLYEVDVKVNDPKDIELDYKTIAKDIKNIISKRSQASVSALMSDLYPSLVGGKYQRMALKYDWSLTNGISTLTGSSRSPYDLAVMAVNPLSYDFEVHIDKTPGIDKIYDIVERIFNKINIEFPTLDFSNVKFEIKSLNVGTRTIVVNTTSNGIQLNFTIDVSDLLQEFQDDQLANLNANMQNNISDILKQIAEFNKVGVSFEKSKNDIAGEIIKYLKAFDSKFVNLVNNTNRALQPTLLVVSGGKIHRPGSVEAGEIILVPTSWTAEVFAPAFMKWIKVEGAGGELEKGKVYDGTVKEIPLTVEAGKTYKVTYEAIDFHGKVRKNEYTIVAK